MKQNLLFIVLLISGMVYAASNCSQDAYRKACQNCAVDQFGKMNETCSQGYQSSGQACVASTYPVMATKYAIGMCPAVDACISTLQSCKDAFSLGNDSADCSYPPVEKCFKDSDICVDRASQNCSVPEATPVTNNAGNNNGNSTDFVRGLEDDIIHMCPFGLMILAVGICAVYTEIKNR